LYKAQIPAVLTYTAPRVQAKNPDGSLQYDASGQRVWEPGSGQTQTIEVHLTPESAGFGDDRPGVDVSEVRYEGRVVKTPPGTPLELPTGIREFALSVGGVEGVLYIRPVAVDQHKTERRKLGALFRAAWRA
jgi:hypothetical protein